MFVVHDPCNIRASSADRHTDHPRSCVCYPHLPPPATPQMGLLAYPVPTYPTHFPATPQMGIGIVRCVSGCTCEDKEFDGHDNKQVRHLVP